MSSEIYLASDSVFIGINDSSNTYSYELERSGWFIELALDGAVEIDSKGFLPGEIRVGYTEAGQKAIKSLSDGQPVFISLFLGENFDNEKDILKYTQSYRFSATMAFSLLNIISILKRNHLDLEKEMRFKYYVQLLFAQLNRSDFKKCPVRFIDLMKTFEVISSLVSHKVFPSTVQLSQQAGLTKFQFQKACIIIYGQPLLQIIHHMKMERAYGFITMERTEIEKASDSLGYRHSSNFITAFHRYFGLTPLETIHFHTS